MKNFFIFIILFSLVYFINSISNITKVESVKDSNITEEININIGYEYFSHIGYKGNMYFNTKYDDSNTNIFDPSDIEELTSYSTSIREYMNNIYTALVCHLWKPKRDNLKLFCHMDSYWWNNGKKLVLSKASFNYKQYKINIVPQDLYSLDYFYLYRRRKRIL